MATENKTKREFPELRKRAEARVTNPVKPADSLAGRDPNRLIHELEVHRIELELQNEELREAKAKLDASYDELYVCAPVAYFTLGRYGDIEMTNLSGASMLGQPRAELLGRRMANFVSPESLPCFNDFLRRVMAGSRKESCVVTLMKGGDISVVAYIEATCARPDSSCRAVAVDITSAEKEGLAARENEGRLKLALQQRAAEHLANEETLRRRIATDLHDGLGQSLSLLKLEIQGALGQMDGGAPSKAVESVKQLLPKVKGALDELRRVSTDLRPAILDDLGITTTLSWFVREIENTNLKTRVEKTVEVDEKDVPQPLKIVIFRILQEAVNNALQHADAARIRIRLYNKADALAFTIEDNGKGFDPGAPASRGDPRMGIGLQSMKERAELSGGTYTLTSAVGKGTKICVLWPAVKSADGQ